MPTARGWAVAACGAALLTLGVVWDYRELAVLGAAALLVVALAVALARPPGRIAVHRRPAASRVAPGGSVAVDVTLSADGRRRFPRLAERVAGLGEERMIDLPDAGAAGSVRYRLAAGRRGVLELGPVQARRSDPFGLAAATRRYGGTDRVWVHPRWTPLRSLPVGRVPDPDGVLDGAKSGNLTFHALRDYVLGDDLRHVHWRSSARQGRLVVREYIDTSHARIALLVDDRGAADGRDGLDAVAEAAASVAVTALRSGLRCDLRLVSGAARDGAAGVHRLLDLLAEAEPTPEADLARTCRALRTRRAGDTVVLVSAGLSDDDLRVFAELRDCCPGLVAVLLGPASGRVAPSGVTVLPARDPADFVRRWNEAPWAR
ncbi:DUF58 domain-containing protein [Marinactinospora rubrisoli]|uniref:DUF58 domain-containing protein n=1 Tax=Marinactinospora rubrisoli TaxID=2715399 RepID=A0ABW2KBG0_9ACTN